MDTRGEVDAGIVTRLCDLGPVRLGALLRSIRIQRMQSPRDIARQIGANARTLRRYERGRLPIPRDTLTALVEYYGEDLTARFDSPASRRGRSEVVVVATETTPHCSVNENASTDPAKMSSDLAVETVLADFALLRLGTLLQSTREERSDSRRAVASQVGTTARELRRYETGRAPVPHGILTALAEFYGEDLDSRFGHRRTHTAAPPRVESVEDAQIHLGDGDEVVGAYIEMLSRRPEAALGQPLPLEPEEVAALSTALAVDPDQVGGRVTELLAWTTRVRHYRRQRRRKRIVSGAGLAVALATGGGFAVGSLVGAMPSRAGEITSAVANSSTTVAAPSTVAGTTTTTTTTTTTATATATTIDASQTVPATTVVTATEASPTVPETTMATPTAPPTTFMAIGPAVTAVAPSTTTTMPRPVITTDTTPMSIPEGETPSTITTATTP